jgi:Tol biopolymer transport system component
LAEPEEGFNCVNPSRLEGAEYLIYGRATQVREQQSEITLHSLATGEKIPLFPGLDPVYLESGHLVYGERGLGLLARRFDRDTFQYGGQVPLVDDIATIGRTVSFAIADTGTLIYRKVGATAAGESFLAIVDEVGIVETLNAPSRDYQYLSVSPNGEQVAVQIGQDNDADVYVYDLSGESELRQLTFDGTGIQPVWSPDGDWICYTSEVNGKQRLFLQRADGSGVPIALTEPDGAHNERTPAWTPDGSAVAYLHEDGQGNDDLWILSVPDGTPEFLIGGEGEQWAIAFAPNGQALAYTDGVDLVVEPYPPDGSRIRASSPDSSGIYPFWSRDSDSLFYRNASGNVEAVDLSFPGFVVSNRRQLPFVSDVFRPASTMPEAERLLMALSATESDRTGSAQMNQIVVVQNWFEEFNRLVPTD